MNAATWVPGRAGFVRSPLLPGALVFPPAAMAAADDARPVQKHVPSVPVDEADSVVAFHHVPVMRDEVVEWLGAAPAGWVVDATCGGGGHAHAVLAAHPQLSVLGLDRDPEAVRAATARLGEFGARAVVVHRRFDLIREAINESLGGGALVSGVLFDLGVSSVQFDRPERGFSYRGDGPIDMRMDPTTGRSAADIVNNDDEGTLADTLKRNADERFARRIARAIVAARPIATTGQLSDVVSAAIPAPARREGGHPAKRTFQALRIAVNEELDVLGPALDASIDLLTPGGRCVVLAYHSGEDRIVKDRFLLAETGGCTCPVGLPCICGALPRGRRMRRGVTRPSAVELRTNPRAASAVARVFEKAGLSGTDVSRSAQPGRN
jgi:16S rRNA (cytosine1402-N4)-methyltransferase